MDAYENEVKLIEYLKVLGKKKWLIIIPTLFCVVVTGIVTALLPPKWGIDALLQPGKYIIQTDGGSFNEIVVVDPRQVVSEINSDSYSGLIAAKLNIAADNFPDLRAEHVRDTKLVRMTATAKDPEQGQAVLQTLFDFLKASMNQKVEVEIKGLDTKIASNEDEIKKKEIDINSQDIEITKAKQEIESAQNKRKISEEYCARVAEEIKLVKTRIDEIEKQQKSALAERREGGEALALLLYANEIQKNIAYSHTMDEKLSEERITQEDLRLLMREKGEDIKSFKNEIEKLHREIAIIKNDNGFLAQKKARTDYAQLIKAPSVSAHPVSPKPVSAVIFAALAGLLIFSLLVIFIDSYKKATSRP